MNLVWTDLEHRQLLMPFRHARILALKLTYGNDYTLTGGQLWVSLRLVRQILELDLSELRVCSFDMRHIDAREVARVVRNGL